MNAPTLPTPPTRSGALAAIAALTLTSSALAQDLIKKAPPQEHPVLIVNAVIHPVSSDPVGGNGAGGGAGAEGWILFDKGVITALGTGQPPSAEGSLVVEGAGRHVYPGLISPYTQLGLTEIQAVRATRDMDEVGAGGVSPEVFAAVSINPDSTLIPVTRANGVLIAGVFPTGGAIPGRASVLTLDGWTWEDMTISRDAGLVIAWPWMRPVQAWWMDQSEEDQLRELRERTEAIESAFRQAKAYADARAADPSLPTDLRWDAMAGVLAGTSPVWIEAAEYDQIVAAVSFSQRYGLKPIIVGGRDAPLCADLLKRHDIPVVVTGTFRFPKRDDSAYDAAFTLPAALEAAGLRWCLSGGDDTAHERNLPYAAALAVAYGLSPDAALRAITTSAAEIIGIADRYGALETGKSATLIITDGDPLEVTTNVHAAFIDGRRIDLTSKQSALEEKYREKYRQSGQLKR